MIRRGRVLDLPKIERPREKLLRYGVHRLTNAELLAMLLRTGIHKRSALVMAQSLLNRFGQEKIVDVKMEDLQHQSGIGLAKACELIACFELGKRFFGEKKASLFLSAEDVWRELRDIRDNKKEHFVAIYLDTRSQEIKRDVVSVGTLNASLVHPREVFEPAIRHSAAQIIVAHNHPSGDPEPSREDIAVTQRLVEAGELLGIELLDHVVVARNSYVSSKEQGII